jgi:hemerythrin
MSNNEKVHWEQSYSVGIKPIDTQHKKLFDLVNKLYDLEENANVKEEIREILYAFRDYTIVHFKDEEAYMWAIGYPELEEHKEIHEQIVERLLQIIQTPANLSIIKTKMKMVAKRVLVEHIINEDHKIGIYASEHEIKEEIYNLS